ncbi:MAG TPA: hypothetical protein VHG32_08955 [Thermoanaerobaculia bacterium]|jgi:hypothetical protein|nr:hypothetical protein [Thermoanaerobaculia bacterium]
MRPLTLTAGPIYRSSSGPIQAHSIGTEVDLIIGPEVLNGLQGLFVTNNGAVTWQPVNVPGLSGGIPLTTVTVSSATSPQPFTSVPPAPASTR